MSRAKVGDRIEFLGHIEPDPAPLTVGDTGTVTFVDAGGTVHTQWDSGRTLGLTPEGDRYRVISRAEEATDGSA